MAWAHLSLLSSPLHYRADAESTTDHTFIKSDGDAGHPYIEGTLKDVYKMEEIAYDAFCEAAKTIAIGKNTSLFGMWLVHNHSISLPTGGGVIEALHAMLRIPDIEDKERYRLAYGGSSKNILLLQVPAIEHSEVEDLLTYLADMQIQTGVESENRNTAYMSLASSLQMAESHVYAFKIPYAVRNDYFQQTDVAPDTTNFTAYKSFVEFDYGDGDDWNRKGARLRFGWEIPIVCEVETTSFKYKKDDSDTAKHKARVDERKALSEKMKGKFSPMKPKANDATNENGAGD